MKALIFDSGPLINLSMNGLLDILEKLKKGFDGKFFITEQVYYETVQRPLNIKKFELGALMIKDLVERKILELPESVGINSKLLKEESLKFMDIANHYLQANGSWVPLVSEAEMSCLALSAELTEKGMNSLIAIDERTTRLLAEKPRNLERIMSEKLKQRVSLVAENFSIFSRFKFIRSSEIVFVAYKKGLFSLKEKKMLEALLYATKFKGASISFEEIETLKKL